MARGKRDVQVQFDGLGATVRDVKGWHCPKCAEIEFATGEGERYAAALDALRLEARERDAKRLARVRKQLNLTQQEAARLTGGGKNAFSRYERGQAKPMPAVINLFRLLERHPDLLAELQR
jgi:HTH-type transcriptional regulator/antitoxin MqsA